MLFYTTVNEYRVYIHFVNLKPYTKTFTNYQNAGRLVIWIRLFREKKMLHFSQYTRIRNFQKFLSSNFDI